MTASSNVTLAENALLERLPQNSMEDKNKYIYMPVAMAPISLNGKRDVSPLRQRSSGSVKEFFYVAE